ncbi:MAG: DUF4294 domain-containing protein [Chitinophagaceae bacterium]|nr:DUF4294 domain-containing protein [Chitinophagaceae bacterium]
MKRALIIIAMLLSIRSFGQGNVGLQVDTIYMLPEVKVTAQFLNDTDRYRYNQMKFYVTTILPYLDAATKVFKEINAKVNEDGVSRKERKQFVHSREEEMRSSFEEKVKQLNVTQGTLLVKLIARQTEVNLYNILQEFKNPLTAVKWQAWARLNGMNLDRKYQPDEEKDLENIMEELGYPLPPGYRYDYLRRKNAKS